MELVPPPRADDQSVNQQQQQQLLRQNHVEEPRGGGAKAVSRFHDHHPHFDNIDFPFSLMSVSSHQVNTFYCTKTTRVSVCIQSSVMNVCLFSTTLNQVISLKRFSAW